MSDIFEEVGHIAEVVGKGIVKGVEDIITVGGKVIKAIEDVDALTPEFKQELSTLVTDAQAVATAVGPAALTGGANVAVDAAVILPAGEAVIKLAHDFLTFLPSLNAALKTIGADIEQPDTQTIIAVVPATTMPAVV